MNKTLQYRYTHSQTTATTGFFTCLPPEDLTLEEALARLEKSPNDSFMRRHILNDLLQLPQLDVQKNAMRTALSPVINSFSAELSIFDSGTPFTAEDLQAAEPHSPLVYLNAAQRPDQALQEVWRNLFTGNLTGHRKLPTPQENKLPPLYLVSQPSSQSEPDLRDPASHSPSPHSQEQANGQGLTGEVAESATRNMAGTDAAKSRKSAGEAEHWSIKPKATLPELHAKFTAQGVIPGEVWTRPPAEESAARALKRLSACGIIAGEEMRHQASLSPIALQRPWHISLKVQHGRHNYTLEGQANTYGRGLSLPAARASCLMEMVERASAYASISPEGLLHKSGPSEILFARRSKLLDQGHDVIDIAAFHTDRPYNDQPLHFIWGHRPSGKAVLVPLQLVYLFSNLDEPDLCDAPGSTGLAAGNIMEEAKVAALTELLERDAEATNIYHKSRCFALQAEDPEIKRLLDAYAAQGVNIQFQDITSSLGLPCVKCFVISAKGQIHRATGAGLDAKRAVVSALTETPFPFPHGPNSGPQLRNLPVVSYDTLPSYALESPARNLALLEELLSANGLEPVYVDLTRSDLGLPVVRALVPGLHGSAELDSSTPVPRRLYEHYLRMHA